MRLVPILESGCKRLPSALGHPCRGRSGARVTSGTEQPQTLTGVEAMIGTERVGFEPTDAFTSLVFKTRAINHSTTSPYGTTEQLSSSTLEQCCWVYTIFWSAVRRNVFHLSSDITLDHFILLTISILKHYIDVMKVLFN
jgi:hypothetical protein